VEKRDPVPLNLIPDYLQKALITTEDRSFYSHSGVDLKGILRAVVKDIMAGKFVEGASTITQQLAKTLFLTPRKSVVRKLKEALLAFQLERRYTKDEILQLYLNQVYFGSGAYGVESAARLFFGKPVQYLSLAECALLAALPRSPSRYSPLVNRELALKRRNIVLKQMRDTGTISTADFAQASQEALDPPKPGRSAAAAPYFVSYVKNFLEDLLGSSRVYKGGLSVVTTLSYELQQAAEQAILTGLTTLEKRMRQNGLSAPEPQGALVALDVLTGGILAMVGGRDYGRSSYNRAILAQRQPGSAFKPIVYAYAIEHGFRQNSMLLDAPVAFRGATAGLEWRPENFSGTYQGEITLRKALALSENIPAVRLIEKLGPSSVAQFGTTLGIKSSLAPNLSLALGTSEVSLIDITGAYAVFANRGRHITPFGVTEVMDHDGRTLWRVKPRKEVVMSRAGTAILTNMLEAAIQEGTGRAAQVLKRPVAGKTGTTNEYKDALFIGFSPSVAAGVWVGQDDYTTLGRGETGARAALPIWIDFMQKTLAERSYEYFDLPDNVVQVEMDPSTGLLAAENTPDPVTTLFLKGTEPKKFR
jgi:penicillin-binding protein 1A